MDGRWQEPGFLLLEWEVTVKIRKKAGMIHVVIEYSWRHQYKLTLVQYRYRLLHTEIYMGMYM